MGDNSYLFSQLRYWQNEASRLRKEIKKWKNRKNDIEGVQKSLRSVAQNSAGDVNFKITKTSTKLDDSINCPGKEGILDSIFRGKNEYNVDGDSDLSGASTAMTQEIGACERKIAELEGDLSNAENQIRRIQKKIRDL